MQHERSRTGRHGGHAIPLVALAAALMLMGGCGSDDQTETDSEPGGVVRAPDANGQPSDGGAAAPSRRAEAPVSTPGSSPAARTGGEPALTFDRTTHDFGSVSDVELIGTRFGFVNNGDGVLRISDVRTNCDCISAQTTETELAPGASGTIEVEYEPRGDGSYNYNVTVVSNAVVEPVMQLKVTATVVPLLEPDARDPHFGTVALGKSHTLPVTILCPDEQMQILSVQAQSPLLSGEILDPATEEGTPATAERPGRGVVRLRLSDRAPWGSFQTRVTITARARPKPGASPIEHSIELPVRASVFGELHAKPDRVRLSILSPSATFQRKLTISRPSGEPFEILDVRIVDSNLPGIDAGAERAVRSRVPAYLVTITGQTGQHTGDVRGVIVIRTDVPGEEELRIPFDGMVR